MSADKSISIPMKRVELPQKTISDAIQLMGFDFGEDLFHILCFDFGDDDGALGVWREGDNFCARVSLDALAEFWRSAKDAVQPDTARAASPQPVLVTPQWLHDAIMNLPCEYSPKMPIGSTDLVLAYNLGHRDARHAAAELVAAAPSQEGAPK